MPASATMTMSVISWRAWNDFTIGTIVRVSALLPELGHFGLFPRVAAC
jgi:hypothetical protein